MMNGYVKILTLALVALSFMALDFSDAVAQNADCSAAVQRVLQQTNGELLSVQVANNGGQPVCKITVLASDSSGKRRRKMTVNARP